MSIVSLNASLTTSLDSVLSFAVTQPPELVLPPELHQPGVTVAVHGGVEPLAMLEGVQGEDHLHTLHLLLDPEQISLQIELEGDLLQGHATAGVPVQLAHLLDLPLTW